MTSTVGNVLVGKGKTRFDDRSLLDLVNDGAISTGNFCGFFLTMIFRKDIPSFTFIGDRNENGRVLAEFRFSVPDEKSHFHYTFGEEPRHQVVTGYNGTFLADAKTGDLVRLDVSTSRLPAETGVCYSTTTMNYVQVHLGDSKILLPAESRVRFVDVNGAEAENRTVFSNCHEFLGESTISFDAATAGIDSPARQSSAGGLTIPPGLQFQIALTQGIDTATAAAGDPVKAQLTTPIKKGSEVLVPARAAVAGRIVLMRQYYGNDSTLALGVNLEVWM